MSKEKYLGTDYYQLTGKHLMGNNVKREIDPEAVKRAQQMAEEEQMQYVANLMEKDKDCKPFENKKIVPTAGRVVVLPYESVHIRTAELLQDGKIIITGSVDCDGYKNSVYCLNKEPELFVCKKLTLRQWLKNQHPEILEQFEKLNK